MTSLAQGLAMIVLWGAFLFRIPALIRQPKSDLLVAYCVCTGVSATAVTVSLPSNYMALDRWVQLPNLSLLIANELIAIAVCAGFLLVVHLTDEDVSHASRLCRRMVLVTVGVMLVMLVLFVGAWPRPDDPFYSSHQHGSPGFTAYQLLFGVDQGTLLGAIGWLWWRNSRIAQRPIIRLSLRIGALAGLTGWLFFVSQALDIAARGLDYLPPPSELINSVLITLTIVLGVGGVTLPSWGKHLHVDSALTWWSEYRSLVRLEPLWRDIRAAFPEVVILPPSTPIGDLSNPTQVHFKLYRRVVEIRDGLLLADPARNSRQLHNPVLERIAASDRWADREPTDFAAEVQVLESLARAYRVSRP
ncbi:MAG TPA: MAB_1171c family putative transporter [Candidatus Dormibacteraeota bacterium]|jgi:hypothetical protein|nr:MAB_1171c family putative transporter [Candidatus Dormibacteraeota bacterium]